MRRLILAGLAAFLCAMSPAQKAAVRSVPLGHPCPITNGLIASLDPGRSSRLFVGNTSVQSVMGSDKTPYGAKGIYSPTIVYPGGRAAVYVNGGSYLDLSSALPAIRADIANTFSVVIVANIVTSQNPGILLDMGLSTATSPQSRYTMYQNPSDSYGWKVAVDAGSSYPMNIGSAPLTGNHIVIGTADGGSNLTLNYDHQTITNYAVSYTPPNTANFDHISIGTAFISGSTSGNASLYVYRVLIFNRVLSAAEETTLANWASSVWGTP